MIYKQKNRNTEKQKEEHKNGRDAGRGDLFLSCVPAVTVVMTVFRIRPVF